MYTEPDKSVRILVIRYNRVRFHQPTAVDSMIEQQRELALNWIVLNGTKLQNRDWDLNWENGIWVNGTGNHKLKMRMWLGFGVEENTLGDGI